MKKRTVYVSSLFGLAAIVAGTVAIAQPAESSAPVGSDQAPARTPEEILAGAQTTLDRMEATADNISRMLRGSREEKDVVKTLCLDDKLNQINVAVRSAADRVAVIEAAVRGGATERLSHDDAVLGALGSRSGELAVEANQCIGEEQGVAGDSELKVTFDPAIPEGDVSAMPTPLLLSLPPQAASPTL